MLLKQKDPMMLEKKVNTTPVDYSALNQPYKDFETCFVPQTELSAKQAFWSQNSMNSPEPILSSRPTIVEVPKELPKVSMVNTSLKKLKHHLAGFDVVVKERTTSTVIIEGSWGPRERKDTVIKKLKERINALSGKTNEDKIKQELEEIETINIELDHRVTKLIAGMKKFWLHITYIKHTQEEATVLRDLVEHVQSKYPLDQSLESACRYAKLVQELLTNISKTCPSVNNTDEKLVAVTPKNKDKRVRFTEPVTSSGNTITKTTSPSNLVSNKPMLSSTGVKPSTSASGSQPSGNTKKDKIRQTPSSTQMNKVEAYPRKVKSSFKNKDCVVQPKGTAHVQHSKCNVNSELKCVKCNGCMLSDNHDLCVLDFINNVNARKESKYINKSSKRNLVILGDPKFLDCSISSLDEMHVFHNGSLVFWGLGPDSKHMTEDCSQLTNFINKFLGKVKSRNDHVEKILGYGDYQIGNVTISRVYYMEGLGQYLFFVGQFCDSNLEVAFRQHTCFICNLEGIDLLTVSRSLATSVYLST
ncbi:hypothetical protein Tco_0487353 [Tanacetum coccineum]